MKNLWMDTETFSGTPIRVGAYRYAQDSEVMVIAWAIDDEPVQVWDRTAGGAMPARLAAAIADPSVRVYAHNAMFDRPVLRAAGIDIPIERWFCTMTQAMAHSLPGKLDTLCVLFKLPVEDAKLDGKDLIQLFCKPRPKNSKLRRATRETHPREWAAFIKYAGNDIVAMRHLHGKIPRWNYGWEGEVARRELDLWHLDQRINDRGVAVDLELAEAAMGMIGKLIEGYADRTSEMTDGEVASTTKRDLPCAG